tara:strand:- start:3413 stop:4459 length:1047 start_codon:yes stop_codon:yes gene_type:complete
VTDSPLSHQKVAPFRSVWLEGLLTFITMGCYLFVWFALAARDCKRITGRSFTPILWFFVPVICLPLPFALHILLSTFSDIEKERALPGWTKGQNFAFNGLFSSAYIGAYVVGEIIENQMLQFVLWAVAFVLFLLLHGRLNRIRRAFESEPMMHRFAGFNALEWVVGLLFLALWVGLFWALGQLKLVNADTTRIDPGTEIVVAEAGVRFTVNQEGWENVPVGTVTDGTAEYELRGPASLNNMWYAVFTYTEHDDFNEIAQNRYATYLEVLPGAQCTAARSLQEGTDLLRSVVSCENTEAGDKQLYISHLIEREKGLVELVGYMWVAPRKYTQYKPQFIKDVKGLIADEK